MKNILSALLVPLTALSLISSIAIPASAQAQTASASCYTFTRNLGEGRPISTQEATALGQDLSSAGVWNSGTLIISYTDAVASAVSGFQEKYAAQILTPNGLSYGTGFVGVSTRTQLNSLYGCSTSTTQPTQSFHCPAGYTCAPINQNPVFTCPAGYTCTPATTPTNPATPTQPINPITNQQSYLYVLSPNGGESYSPGQTVSIQFSTNITSQQDPDGIKIMLLYGANSTNLQQFNVSQQTLVSNYTGTSPYQWTIPSSLPSGNYTIYIVSNDLTPDGAQHADGSDNYFTIGTQQTQTCPAGQTWNSSWGSCSVQVQQTSGQPYVKIISPDGGQTYSSGQVVPIQFSTNLTSQQAPTGFNIWAYYGGNSTNVGSYASGVPNIVMNYTGGTTYNWTVPSSWSAGNYVIYIVPASVVGVSNTGLFAFGDSYFTINGQTTQTPTCSSGQTWNGSSCVSPNQPSTPVISNVNVDKASYNVGDSYTVTWNLANAQANSQIIIALENGSGVRVYNLTCVPLVTNSCANIPAVNGLGTYTGVIPAGVGQIGSSVSNGQYKFEVELITNGAFTTDGVNNQTVSIPLGGGTIPPTTTNASVQVSANGSPTLQKNIITTGGGTTQTVQYMANFSVNVQAVGAPVTLGLTGSSWPAFVTTAAGIQINKNGVADSLGNYSPVINYQVPSGATSNGTSFTIPTGTTVTIPVTAVFTVTNPGANVYSVQLLGMGWSSATQSNQTASLGGSTWQTQSQ